MTRRDDVPGVELAVIKTGEIAAPHGYVYRADGSLPARLRAGLRVGDDAIVMPCVAFVVRHPAAGVILVDTGFPREARTAARREFGVAMSLFFKGLRPAERSFDEQLRDLAIEPQSVSTVVMTHLHVDHTSAMRLLPNARFTISRAEWLSARGRLAAVRGYVGHHLPIEDRVDLIDLEHEGVPFGPFAKSFDLLGDGTIRLLGTPGHTRGHVSVLVRRHDGSRVLLAGDAAYTVRGIREGVLPMLTDDDEQSRRSLAQLKAFMDEDPAALVVPSHDPDAWRGLARGFSPAAPLPSSR